MIKGQKGECISEKQVNGPLVGNFDKFVLLARTLQCFQLI